MEPFGWGVGTLHRIFRTSLLASGDSAVVGESRAEHHRSLGKRAWALWLRFAEIVGTVQIGDNPHLGLLDHRSRYGHTLYFFIVGAPKCGTTALIFNGVAP